MRESRDLFNISLIVRKWTEISWEVKHLPRVFFSTTSRTVTRSVSTSTLTYTDKTLKEIKQTYRGSFVRGK